MDVAAHTYDPLDRMLAPAQVRVAVIPSGGFTMFSGVPKYFAQWSIVGDATSASHSSGLDEYGNRVVNSRNETA